MSTIRSNTDRAKKAKSMIKFVIISAIVMSPISLFGVFQYNNIVSMNIDRSSLAIYGILAGLIGLVLLVANILAIVYFIMWFRRAYYNLHQIAPKGLHYTEGWAAGAWFIPIFNWFGPYNIATDLFTKTEALLVKNNLMEPNPEQHKAKGWWWGLWIASSISTNISSRSERYLLPDGLLILAIVLTVLSLVLTVGAGYFCLKTIDNYSKMEKLLPELTGKVSSVSSDNQDLLDTI